VNKKEELKKINQENEILKLKIINAKSSVPPLDDIAIHQSKVSQIINFTVFEAQKNPEGKFTHQNQQTRSFGSEVH